MSTTPADSLEQVIRHSGEGWILDFAPPEKGLESVRLALQRAQDCARERLGANSPDLSEDAIIAEYQSNPQRVKAFLQGVAGTRTPELLVMMWRILQGMKIHEVELQYRRQESFRLRVVLTSPYGEPESEEIYESSRITDAAILSHFGTMEINRQPVFDYFYPLRV